MNRKIIKFPSCAAALQLSPKQQEAIDLYNEAVSWHRQDKFQEADEIFHTYFIRSNILPGFDFAWNLSLIKNEITNLFNKIQENTYIPSYDAQIEVLLSNSMRSLLKYSGSLDQSNRTYGLLANKEKTPSFGPSLRYFFKGLPALEPIPQNMTFDFFNVPIVRSFYTAIVENDLKRYGQNKEQVLQLYSENDFLSEFLSERYPG